MRVDRYLETIEWRAKWIEKDTKNILGWLKRNGYLRLGERVRGDGGEWLQAYSRGSGVASIRDHFASRTTIS
jgi:hypothetical protein